MTNLLQKIKIVGTEIWNPDQLEYVKFDSDVLFFCFRPFLYCIVQKIHLAF